MLVDTGPGRNGAPRSPPNFTGSRPFQGLDASGSLPRWPSLLSRHCWRGSPAGPLLLVRSICPRKMPLFAHEGPPTLRWVTVGEGTHYYSISEQLHLFQEGFASPVSHFPQQAFTIVSTPQPLRRGRGHSAGLATSRPAGSRSADPERTCAY